MPYPLPAGHACADASGWAAVAEAALAVEPEVTGLPRAASPRDGAVLPVGVQPSLSAANCCVVVSRSAAARPCPGAPVHAETVLAGDRPARVGVTGVA